MDHAEVHPRSGTVRIGLRGGAGAAQFVAEQGPTERVFVRIGFSGEARPQLNRGYALEVPLAGKQTWKVERISESRPPVVVAKVQGTGTCRPRSAA